MHYPDTTFASYQAQPNTLRVRAVTRRISLSPNVAAVVAELCFGHLDRDHVTVPPANDVEARP